MNTKIKQWNQDEKMNFGQIAEDYDEMTNKKVLIENQHEEWRRQVQEISVKVQGEKSTRALKAHSTMKSLSLTSSGIMICASNI